MAGKVLIIDDDPVVRHILSTVVSSGGYEAMLAESGGEGLAILEGCKKTPATLPICIFLDYFLEDTSGAEVLTQIRAQLGTNYVAVVLISAKTQEEMLFENLTSPPDFFLEKPFKSEVVLSLIKSAQDLRKAD